MLRTVLILRHVCTICSHVQSDDEDKEPTRNLLKDITPSEREVPEQGMDEDVSDHCFEHEEYPALKIIKVETLDREVNQTRLTFMYVIPVL